MATNSEIAPKLFVSYSWSSKEHVDWVIKLASELRDNGVDVILDKWDLKEGHDAHKFMESMVADANVTKVIMVCDRKYAEKADVRNGGVGTETQIISKKVYEQTNDKDSKFVIVVSETNEEGQAFLPAYWGSRIYIDLSDEDIYPQNFEQLLRWIYNQPIHVKPKLGKKPVFLKESAGTEPLEVSSKFRRALDAIKNNKGNSIALVDDYFQSLTEGLESFRLAEQEGREWDDLVVESIDKFTPYRNEAIEIFNALSLHYGDSPDVYQKLHRFFENLIPYYHPKADQGSWREWDFDNLKFIIHELFLYAITALIKYERFSAVRHLLDQDYYYPSRLSSDDVMHPYHYLSRHLPSLDYRNKRLGLRRLSVKSDMLEQRSASSGIPFERLMQTDFTLCLKDFLNSVPVQEGVRVYSDWWPDTLLYIGRYHQPFEIFARAQSKDYFNNKLRQIFGISNLEPLQQFIKACEAGQVQLPRWEFDSFNPKELMGYEKLCTKP